MQFDEADSARGVTRETWERVRAAYNNADDDVLLGIAMSKLAQDLGLITLPPIVPVPPEEGRELIRAALAKLDPLPGEEDAKSVAPGMEHRRS
jgi:hypothetical protein